MISKKLKNTIFIAFIVILAQILISGCSSSNNTINNLSNLDKAYKLKELSNEPFSAKNYLKVNDDSLKWNSIEKNYPAPILKLSPDQDIISTMVEKLNMEFCVYDVLTAGFDVAYLIQCTDHSEDSRGWIPEKEALHGLDKYIALRSFKDQQVRIYSIRNDMFGDLCMDPKAYYGDDDPCHGDARLVSVDSAPFLDSSAVYVKIATRTTNTYESNSSGSSSTALKIINWVFVGDKHRKLGMWEEYTIYSRREWKQDENQSLTSVMKGGYTINSATFDGESISVSTIDEYKTEGNDTID